MLQTTCHPCVSGCGRCLALGDGHDCCLTCLGSKHASWMSHLLTVDAHLGVAARLRYRCPEPSRLDDWFLGVACAGSQRPAPGASLPDVHEELTGRGRHLLLPETDLLTPPPSPPSVVQLGVTGVPLVERSVAIASVSLYCLHPLFCPVRELRYYVERTQSFRTSDQLFVCHGGRQKGNAVSKQRIAHCIVDAITLAYQAQGVPYPFRLRAHSIRSVASSWALARGASLTDICRAAGWATPNTFDRFYSLRVEPVSSCVFTLNG